MSAAVYVRKSSDQTGVADEQKSVSRQIEHARQYAAKKGWLVADEHIYVDDGISGAEFANRPGFLRLMNALKPEPAFHVLIMSEESRLGREAIETAYALKQLITAGVRVFFYLEDRERTLDSPTDKIMLSLTTFADELEREKARQRTRDAMVRKAQAGHVTGGACFGYRNIEIRDAAGQRSHVEREIVPAEANIIRQIFRLSAEGHGVKAIAKRLNAERVPSPRAQQGRLQSWAPSSVREVLFRPLYRGEVLWAQTAKRNRWGQKRQAARPESDWIRRAAPALRIVSDDEWNAAHSRLSAARELYLKATDGRSFGRPAVGNPSKYLLTNLAQCFQCGGPLQACSRSHGRERKRFYGCSAYHDRGRVICPNGRDVPMQDANDILIEALMDDVLDPSMVADAVESAIEILRSEDGGTARATAIDDEMERLGQERSRLVSAVTDGQLQGGILDVLRALETRTARLERERQALGPRLILPPIARLRAELLALAGSWRRVLLDDPTNARPIVLSLLVGRVTYAPLEDGRWRLTGEATLSGLFERIFSVGMASPTGSAIDYQPIFEGIWVSDRAA